MNRQMAMYYKRKESGLCVDCSVPLESKKYVRCQHCRKKDTDKSIKYYNTNGKEIKAKYQHNRISTRKMNRQCIVCGISNASEYTKCQQCRRSASESTCKYVKHNLKGRIIAGLRSRLRLAMKGKRKSAPFMKLLGCSTDELKTYLESKFQPGMSWDNYGKWHIDHIRPLSKLDLTDPQQLNIACHYSNLQPLWALDNLRKHNKE